MGFRTFCSVVFLMLGTNAFADDSFGGYQSQHDKLKGYQIVDAGNTKEFKTPIEKKRILQLYQLNERCFTMSSYFGLWGYAGRASMLLVNDNKDVKLALIEKNISDLEVKIEPISLVECQSDDDDLSNCGSAENCMKKMDKLQQKMLRQQKETESEIIRLKKSLGQ